jgi:hypothetical protein
MKGLGLFRWVVPAAVAALLSVPVQTANARGTRGGGGHMGGRVHMGGVGGPRSHAGTATHFYSRTGASHFGTHQNLAVRNHNFGRSAGRTNRFADRGRFGNQRFGRQGRFEGRGEREFFFRHNFFVGFNFGAFGWWPWWGWGGPWWWGWDGWAYPYPYYGYGYSYDDPPGDASQDNGSQYEAEYWNNLALSVQTKLADQGYYHGQIDGVIGSGTIQAVRQFQTDHGLPVTGKIDPDLLNALGINYKAQS